MGDTTAVVLTASEMGLFWGDMGQASRRTLRLCYCTIKSRDLWALDALFNGRFSVRVAALSTPDLKHLCVNASLDHGDLSYCERTGKWLIQLLDLALERHLLPGQWDKYIALVELPEDGREYTVVLGEYEDVPHASE